MRRYILLLVFVLSVCFAANAEARKMALLIGVDEYANVPPLKCCVNDMKELKKALIKIGFEEYDIQMLVTGGPYKNFPTKKNIEKAISKMITDAQPSDMVFLAFSGHGAQEGKNVYFCPPDVETEELKETCVSINKVMDLLANKCQAKFKWMVVDACRNDPTRGAKGIGSKGLQVIPTPPAGIALFQSCAEGEESWEDRESGNGYFTKNFTAALSGEADANHDGKLTLMEVFTWTTAHTKEQVKISHNKSQRPYFSGSFSDFTLTEDINVPKARALVEEARLAVDEENYALAIKKFDEAIALCPKFENWKRERKSAQKLFDAEKKVKEERTHKEETENHDWSNPGKFDEDRNTTIDSELNKAQDSAKDIPEIQEGIKALQNNDIEGALAKFEEARRSHPEFSPAELMLAKLALQINPQKNGAAARMLIERCVKNIPDDPEAYVYLGDYNLGNGSITEADLLFLKAGVLLKNFYGNSQRKSAMIRQFNMGMGMVQERRGKYEQAKAYLESYLKSDPGNDKAKQMLARINTKIDMAQEYRNQMEELKDIANQLVLGALQTTNTSQVFNNSQTIPEIQEGLRALQNNDVEGALKKFEDARRYHPEFSPAELMLAKLALQINPQSNGAPARLLIERCVKNNPDDPEAYIFLGDYNLGNGSITEADLLFRKAGSLLAKFYGNSQRKSAMIRQFNAGMAMVLERRGQYEQAMSYMESCLKSDPDNVGAMQQMARIYLNMNRPSDAIAQLTRAKAIQNDILTPEAIVAMFYQQKGDNNMAAMYMNKALNKAPRDFSTRLAAAAWYQTDNRIDQAISQVNYALQLNPRSEAALSLRGNLALTQKDYARAIEMYNRILANSPDNFAVTNNIALALCETGNRYDLKRAVELAGVNAQRNSSDPVAFSTLGYVLFKNGDIDNSLKALQKSLELSNGRMSPDTAYFLCAALVAKGTEKGVKQAKEILTKTLDATPTFNMRPEAMRLKAKLDRL